MGKVLFLHKKFGFMTHDYIILSNSKLLIRVSSSEIIYVFSEGSYSTMVLTYKRQHVFSFNLSAFEKQLETQLGIESQSFIRLGKSLIINSDYIYSIDIVRQEIVLFSPQTNEKFSLPVSLKALKTLKKIIENNIDRRLRI